MDKCAHEMITKEAARILNEIKGNSIFGEVVDFSNYDMLIVAAYYAGQFIGSSIEEQRKPVGTLFEIPVYATGDFPKVKDGYIIFGN